MIDLLTNYYKELILAGSMGIFELIFSVSGGHGMLYRGIAVALNYPLAIAMGSGSVYALCIRIIGVKMFHDSGHFSIRKALPFLPVSLIGGFVGSAIILKFASSPYMYLGMGILLLAMSITKRPGLQNNSQHASGLSIYKKSIGYILMIGADSITTIVGGGGIMMNYLLKHFFNIGTLEATGMRKFFILGRSFLTILTYGLAGTLSWSLLLIMIVLGVPAYIIGTKYILKKGNDFAEHLLTYLTIFFGCFMIYKAYLLL